nr:Werner Syndrome-like exonuclease isoform X1 [Ipomoea batatas]GME12244.1 Werner Syndrome-like exonuclease isoform X1 [Ipomoea batatas]
METSVPSSMSGLDDWDRPFTDQELLEIEVAFQSATNKRNDSDKSSVPAAEDEVNGDGNKFRRNHRRRLPESLFSTSFSLAPCPRSRFKHQLNRFPGLAFRGRVVYSRTAVEAEKSAAELLNFIETRKRAEGVVALGFDIEWKPTFKRGVAPGKAAVMQICGEMNRCYVFHIFHSGIPQNLQTLLGNSATVKVGVNIVNDAHKVFLDHNVPVRNLEDLSALANLKIGGVPKNWSLASLTETLFCKQLPKPNHIRLGNWETPVLSKEHLNYAATDAFVSWHLYQALKSLPEPEPVDIKSNEPEHVSSE